MSRLKDFFKNIPLYKSKYLSLVGTEEEFEELDFEEVLISGISTDTNTPDIYKPSTRHNIYEDYKYEMPHNLEDGLRMKAALEIIWGYFGWEWKDCEYDNGEEIITLHGGNMYKINPLEKVPSIIDGDRLLHINDFLNSQEAVTEIGYFNTENIVLANNAFKRVPIYSYWEGDKYVSIKLNILDFPNLEQANSMFEGFMLITDFENNVLNFPKLKEASSFFRASIITSDTPILNFGKITALLRMYESAAFLTTHINLNNLIDADTIKRITDFSNGFASLKPCVFDIEGEYSKYYLEADFTGSSAESLNLRSLFLNAVVSRYDPNTKKINRIDDNTKFKTQVNLKYDVPVNLLLAFMNIANNANKRLEVSFLGSDVNLIDNLREAFKQNHFQDVIPITQWNGHSSEDYIYQQCVFYSPINYDFSPNMTLNMSIELFTGAEFKNGFSFNHLEYVNKLILKDLKFPEGSAELFLNYDLCTDIDYDYSITNEEKLYRTINIINCPFTSVKGLTIKVLSGLNNNDGIVKLFLGCSKIDFTDHVNKVIVDIIAGKGSPGGWIYNFGLDFTGCSEMTETPYLRTSSIVGKEEVHPGKNFNLKIDFTNCRKLKVFHGEDFNFKCTSLADMANHKIDFSVVHDTIRKIYIGQTKQVGLNLKDCYFGFSTTVGVPDEDDAQTNLLILYNSLKNMMGGNVTMFTKTEIEIQSFIADKLEELYSNDNSMNKTLNSTFREYLLYKGFTYEVIIPGLV